MSFGYSRPHSTESWRSRRPSFELSSRMHSVPRNIKTPGRPTSSNYTADFHFESPLYYMHRNDSSRENVSSRSPGKNFEMEDPYNAKYQQKMELQRKMTFNLHEEIQKPFLTIVLEEISDPDRINDICLNTLTTMMRSKKYRKYVHHMNNSAIPSSERFDVSHNKPGILKKINVKGLKFGKDDEGEQGSSKKGDEKRGSKNGNDLTTMQFEEYQKLTLINRKRRQDEIHALDKLKSKLRPTVKKTIKPSAQATTEDEEDESERRPGNVKINQILNTLSSGKGGYSKGPSDENVVATPKEKTRPKATAEETLKIKWLRLTDAQVADLEAEVRASGKDPGIHHFSKKETVDTYASTPATAHGMIAMSPFTKPKTNGLKKHP